VVGSLQRGELAGRSEEMVLRDRLLVTPISSSFTMSQIEDAGGGERYRSPDIARPLRFCILEASKVQCCGPSMLGDRKSQGPRGQQDDQKAHEGFAMRVASRTAVPRRLRD
jgi:hypothetical protein